VLVEKSFEKRFCGKHEESLDECLVSSISKAQYKVWSETNGLHLPLLL